MGLFTRKEDGVDADLASSAPRARRTRIAAGDGPLDPLDPLEMAKRRARRRLIGAIALVLGAVVILPMVFDSEPKSQNDDLSVEIPGRDSSFTPTLPPQPAPVTPSVSSLVPGAPAMPAQSSASAASVTPVAPASGTSTPTVHAAAPLPAVSQPAAPVAKATDTAKAPAPSDKTASAKVAPVTTKGDDPRALAALEGKSVTPTTKDGASGDGFAVQIGAFSNADKVKDVRERLAAAGLHPYTESLTTPQGPRTRVRVGPFSTHEAAEEAREKAKGLGLDGSVVSL